MSYDETYYDKHALVRVHGDGHECWADIEFRPETPADSVNVELEFLLQPRNKVGLPVGGPLLLHTQTFRLLQSAKGKRFHAWAWLPPRLTPDVLKRCHLRLRSPKLGDTTSQAS